MKIRLFDYNSIGISWCIAGMLLTLLSVFVPLEFAWYVACLVFIATLTGARFFNNRMIAVASPSLLAAVADEYPELRAMVSGATTPIRYYELFEQVESIRKNRKDHKALSAQKQAG